MKAERRHELHTNTLVDSLGETLTYIKTQSQTIIIAVLVVVVVGGGVLYWRHSTAVRRAQGWENMLSAVTSTASQDPQYLDKLEQVAVSYRDPALRAMAYAQLGNELLGQATFAPLPGEKAAEYRQRAESAFNKALEAGDQPVSAAIARLGLATIAANRGSYDAAREQYEAVANDARLKGTPYPAQASAQLKALNQAATLPPLAVSTQPAAVSAAPATRPPAEAVPATQPGQG